jgi:bacterioferritin-associated ferredoxin
MYVCVCNALTDADVRQAVLACGARRPAEVFAACGCRAQCGSCVRALCDLSRREAMIAPFVLAASTAGAVPDSSAERVPDGVAELEEAL